MLLELSIALYKSVFPILGLLLRASLPCLYRRAGTIAPGILIISLGIIWILGERPVQMEISWNALIPEFKGISDLVFLAGLFLAFAGLRYIRNSLVNRREGIICSCLNR